MSVTRSEAKAILEEIKDKAKRIFGFHRNVQFVIRNMGTVGGYAHRSMKLEINVQYLNNSYQDVYYIIAHEMAHLVCFDQPHLGKGHNAGWKRVCRALGGNGERCHSHSFKPKRRTRQAIYNLNGQTVKVGLTQHKRIQQSSNYRYRMNKCGTQILPEMFTGELVYKGA